MSGVPDTEVVVGDFRRLKKKPHSDRLPTLKLIKAVSGKAILLQGESSGQGNLGKAR